ncbi:MAG: PQQ-binding-like beta-propeller repeat protein [Planctomycetaceae bacterium]
MSELAILPILPALGGLLWGLALLGGLLLSLLHPRGWRMWGAFLRSQWRGLAVLTIVGLMAYLGWSSWRRLPEATTSSPVSLRLDGWPMFQQSPQRIGGDGAPGPIRGGVNWTSRVDYEFLGAPAVSERSVVAIGHRRGVSRIFIWDIDTGREVWSGAPDNYRITGASPVLSDGRIFCGEGVHDTRDARICCLDPSRSPSPCVWELATNSHIEGTPILSGGRVYLAAGDDGVYCLSSSVTRPAAGGASETTTLQPQIVWHVPGAALPDAETALLVHAGRVFVGLGFEKQGLVALDAESGAELQRVDLPLPMFAPPALFAGGLLCGLGPGTLVNAPTAGSGEARLIDLENLETRWTIPLSASMVQSAAVAGDVACIVSADGHVLTVDPHGVPLANWRSASPIQAAPALSGVHVYVVSADGLLTGLSLADLTPVWQTRLGDPGRYLGSPVVCRGRVLIGTPHGFMSVGQPPEH